MIKKMAKMIKQNNLKTTTWQKQWKNIKNMTK